MENRSRSVIPSEFLIDTHFRPVRSPIAHRPGGTAAYRFTKKNVFGQCGDDLCRQIFPRRNPSKNSFLIVNPKSMGTELGSDIRETGSLIPTTISNAIRLFGTDKLRE